VVGFGLAVGKSLKQAMFAKGDNPQAMAEHLVKVAQAHPYSSYDDVTCIVVKIEV
jgi:serine/threonine protein phosphatase PrpC